jgi:hypothetical protein
MLSAANGVDYAYRSTGDPGARQHHAESAADVHAFLTGA